MEFKIDRNNCTLSFAGPNRESVFSDSPSSLVVPEVDHVITFKIYDLDGILVHYEQYKHIMAKDIIDATIKLSTQTAIEHPGYELVILMVTSFEVPGRIQPGSGYKTWDGTEVTLRKTDNLDSECLVDENNRHYYNRPSDMGRLTGTNHSSTGNIRTGLFYSNPEYY